VAPKLLKAPINPCKITIAGPSPASAYLKLPSVFNWSVIDFFLFSLNRKCNSFLLDRNRFHYQLFRVMNNVLAHKQRTFPVFINNVVKSGKKWYKLYIFDI
jgi:hypothetical protein